MSDFGFSGSEHGLTVPQRNTLTRLLTPQTGMTPGFVRHGSCIGADDQFGWIAHTLGYWVILHPPNNPRKRAYSYCDEILPEEPYLTRNHHIVDSSPRMLFGPGTMEETLRSGTWATVRYAKKAERNGVIVLPNGTPVNLSEYVTRY